MPRPGLSVDRAFNEVRKAVQAETGTQRPESNRNDLSNPDAVVLVARLPDLAQGVDQQTLREREAAAAWAIIEGAQGDALFKMDLVDRFMRTFQDTSYFALAAQKKLDLDTAEVARLEAIRADEAWSAAKESGVLAPLQAFIEAYPDSPHLAEARRRIAMLHLFDSADERARASQVSGKTPLEATWPAGLDAVEILRQLRGRPDALVLLKANSNALGSDVRKRLQSQLQREGYCSGPVDGAFGPQTFVALAAYQSDPLH